ncbi:hypothetical protein CGERO_07065 [Corynebacterium gerontici]|uniref:Uncharacterized protein n=1 Tax=Corynebacterium gerontici TaxID=2079234 RepID=A0A3G6J1Y1_9CORY|nr:hypothetical protein CGERO_07065 [Corynebacterium gerontici]
MVYFILLTSVLIQVVDRVAIAELRCLEGRCGFILTSRNGDLVLTRNLHFTIGQCSHETIASEQVIASRPHRYPENLFNWHPSPSEAVQER